MPDSESHVSGTALEIMMKTVSRNNTTNASHPPVNQAGIVIIM